MTTAFWGALAALLVPQTPPPRPPAIQSPAPLLLELEARADALPLAAAVSARARTVAVRSDLLEDAAGRPGATLALEGFDGERWTLRGIAARPAWRGGRVFEARVVDAGGGERGDLVLSVFEDAVAGSVRVDERLLRVEPAGDGAHRLVEIDEHAFPPCATRGEEHLVEHPAHAGGPQQAPKGGALAATTNLPTVDVMVVYTTQAKNQQGGTNAMNALINLAVTETNQAYQNSDVGQRLRLVHAEELVGYSESGNFSTELNRLTNPGDGWFDNVHALRDQYGADEVSMFIASTQYCGIAWLMGNPSHAFQSSAFNVVSRTCATGYYSFGHELGHNMGSHHDIANAGGNPSFPYSYGWRTANGAWRTILAYAPGTRIKWFSNPSKTYNGQVLGATGQAENWKSLDGTAPTTSQWRCAVPAPYGQGKFSSSLNLPRMTWSGKPVSDGSGGFTVGVLDAEPNNTAIVFYGFAPDSAPFLGGVRWVAPPVTRLPPQVLDGSGSATWSFPITLFAPGDELYVQGWFRDPAHPDGTGSGLTDALRIDVCQFP